MRTCVVSNQVYKKQDLIRITATKDNVVSIDLTGKAHGRGAYLKLDKDIILKAKETNVLEKRLKTKVPDEIYEELLKKLDE